CRRDRAARPRLAERRRRTQSDPSRAVSDPSSTPAHRGLSPPRPGQRCVRAWRHARGRSACRRPQRAAGWRAVRLPSPSLLKVCHDLPCSSMIVAHLDLDAFFAAVEELEEPRYRTIPLIVGGDPRGRGVVATANYVARGFGIHSAMSCAEALRRCPHATFVRPRRSLYRDYSHEVWSTVR